MCKIKDLIRTEYPDWYAKKSAQPRPKKSIREANAKKTNTRRVPVKPEYVVGLITAQA